MKRDLRGIPNRHTTLDASLPFRKQNLTRTDVAVGHHARTAVGRETATERH